MMGTVSNRQHRQGAIERHIGNRLKELRKERGYTRPQVDKIACQPVGTCKMLEQGDLFLGSAHLFTLSRVLGVLPSFFFDDLPSDHSGTFEGSVITPETSDLIKAFQDIGDPDIRRSIVGLFEAVAEDPTYGAKIISLR